MSNANALLVKARTVARRLGHTESEAQREYQDWHITVRMGMSFVSVWTSAGIVFLSIAGIPVYLRSGPWEQYLDLLFRRAVNGEKAPSGREQANDLRSRFLESLGSSQDS